MSHYTQITPADAEAATEVLRQAQAELTVRGHTSGVMRNKGGQVCMLGAIEAGWKVGLAEPGVATHDELRARWAAIEALRITCEEIHDSSIVLTNDYLYTVQPKSGARRVVDPEALDEILDDFECAIQLLDKHPERVLL